MQINQPISLIWFETNLRTSDNQALHLACQSQELVMPIYIFDPYFYTNWQYQSPVRTRFLLECLKNLNQKIKLNFFHGAYLQVFQELVNRLKDSGFTPTLFYTPDKQTQYEIEQRRLIVDFFQNNRLKTIKCHRDYIEQTATDDTWREKYYQHNKQEVYSQPTKINLYQQNLGNYSIKQFCQQYPSFNSKKSALFEGGEDVANQNTNDFLNTRFIGYHWKLSQPYPAFLGATSLMSPHLVFGTISNRQIYQKVRQKMLNCQNAKQKFSLGAFLDRLRWQASFNQRLALHPEIEWQNRFAEFDQLYNNQPLQGQKLEFFEKWKAGQTGFPLVDASMRCLNQTGWINFRMRAMCATFLTINCGVSWHFGAQYFMQKLVDGELAINHWQWQMQAGITNPLSPTFRIYNPTKNLQEKDPKLEFVHKFVPELANFSLNQILLGNHYQNDSKYPKPMLDFLLTKKVNGKVMADLRQAVRNRILEQKGQDLEDGRISKKVVEKYYEIKDKRYRQIKNIVQDRQENLF